MGRCGETNVIVDKDEFYRDILEGMAMYTRSEFQRDVLATLSRHDVPGLGVALNKNQMASKMWLADTLLAAAGPRFANIRILGGWVGVLGAVLLHDPRFSIDRVESVDIDPGCAPVAFSLNATHARTGRFTARTADMLDIDYESVASVHTPIPDLVINTSCEHLQEFAQWYERIPSGQLLVLQSNDYYACDEHVNCVPDLAAFEAQSPMRDVLFAGERKMRRCVRFMRIGRK